MAKNSPYYPIAHNVRGPVRRLKSINRKNARNSWARTDIADTAAAARRGADTNRRTWIPGAARVAGLQAHIAAAAASGISGSTAARDAIRSKIYDKSNDRESR